MGMSNKELKKRLLVAFRGESVERMRVLSSDFLKLENGGAEHDLPAIIESSYLELHSLKGAARAVGLGAVELFCHNFESFFSVIIKKSLIPSPHTSSIMLDWLDVLDEIIRQEDSSETSLAAPTPALALSQMKAYVESPQLVAAFVESGAKSASIESAEPDMEEFVLQNVLQPDENKESGDQGGQSDSDEIVASDKHAGTVEDSAGVSRPAMSDTMRISSSLVTGLLLRTEELISSRNAQTTRAKEILDLERKFSECLNLFNSICDEKTEGSGKELNSYDEMQKKLVNFSRDLSLFSSDVQKAQWEISSKVDSLLGGFKNSMLLPFSSLMEGFPHMVRKLSAEYGKKCELEVSGDEISIDRRILEMLRDPLLHMIRNSIGHGIGNVQERLARGKPACGKIYFTITQPDRDIVKIVYGDDGAGIDCDKLCAKAVQQGLVSQEEASLLDRRAVMEFIFVSGMSTSRILTDLSGRGLGMAIVRDKVESLGGSVVVASPEGKGVRVVMTIPVVLTSFRGIVVTVSEKQFVIPKSGVRKVLLIRQEDIGSAGGRETVLFAGRPVPLVGLSDILELGAVDNNKDSFPVFIMGKGRKAIAVSVEDLLGEQEVMAKSMGGMLKRVRNISGISMLGTGCLAPILHVPDVIRTAIGISSGAKVKSFTHQIGPKDMKTVLIVEDSITSRMLLKNVLEAAGYRVLTAVDGRDGLNSIKQEVPDILVSDVEMPHMDGFTLTAEVRKLPQSSSLPVVLVTSLGSQQDRERGVEAGADAYIIKSSFEQGNLLEVIKRLVG